MRIKTLQQTHPDYNAERNAKCRAIAEGGEMFHALKEKLFPKRFVEPTDVYAERLSLVTYTNHVGPSLSRLSALLFAESPAVAAQGVWWGGFLADVDRQGSSWSSFWRARTEDALTCRWAWAWVNLPARGGVEVRTRADEESLGLLNAYLVRFLPEQVLDWGEDEAGGLLWIMARDVVERRPSIESPRQTVYRWRYIDATEVRTWEWEATRERPVPTDEDIATERPPVPHGFGRIPVTRIQLPRHLWILAMVYDVALAATRAENDLTWALHQAANELLVLTSKWEEATPILGHGHYLQLGRDADGEDKANFIAPSGMAFDHLEKRVQEARDDVFRAFGQLAVAASSDGPKAQMSADSKAADWQAAEILLAALAEPVLDAMRDTLALLADVRGESAPPVSGLDGWQAEDIEAFLAAVAGAQDARELSPGFRRLVAKRQAIRILRDEVTAEELAAVLTEIDESDPERSGPLFAGAARRPAAGAAGADADPAADEAT